MILLLCIHINVNLVNLDSSLNWQTFNFTQYLDTSVVTVVGANSAVMNDKEINVTLTFSFISNSASWVKIGKLPFGIQLASIYQRSVNYNSPLEIRIDSNGNIYCRSNTGESGLTFYATFSFLKSN